MLHRRRIRLNGPAGQSPARVGRDAVVLGVLGVLFRRRHLCISIRIVEPSWACGVHGRGIMHGTEECPFTAMFRLGYAWAREFMPPGIGNWHWHPYTANRTVETHPSLTFPYIHSLARRSPPWLRVHAQAPPARARFGRQRAKGG